MGRTGGTWNTRGTWIAGGALAVVLALTGYVALSGDDDGKDTTPAGKGSASASSSASPGPSATYARPDGWTEPERWAALPRGKRTDGRGSAVGFPHTIEGAVAMMAAANNTAIEDGTSTADEQLRIYHSYVAQADQTASNAEAIELQAQKTDKSFARQMGVSPGQPLPSGAYVRSTVVGYKVIKESDDQASVWLLSRVVQKNGELKKEAGSYTRIIMGAQWEAGDWKMTGGATRLAYQDSQEQAPPQMVAPGDAAFNAAGWTALREAS